MALNISRFQANDDFNMDGFHGVIDQINTGMNDEIGSINQAIQGLSGNQLRLQIGSYVGNGQNGAENPNTLTFDFVPKVVGVIVDAVGMSNVGTIFIYGQTKNNGIGSMANSGAGLELTVSWGGSSISWYTGNGPGEQLNGEKKTYYYFAIG